MGLIDEIDFRTDNIRVRLLPLEDVINVPDTFPPEWVEEEPEDEAGYIVFAERKWGRLREVYRVGFNMPGGFPRNLGEERQATIEHVFTAEVRIRDDLIFVEGPVPWQPWWALPELITTLTPAECVVAPGDSLDLALTLSCHC